MVDYKIANQGIDGLVSVIMPTHNRCALVEDTIQSLLEQTYPKIEIIIVDDHSTDNTKECIDYYVRKYDFIHYFMSEGQGACAARNLGVSKAQGEYIQFMDDDDLLHEDFIKMRVIALENNKHAGFATCNMLYFQRNLQNVVKYFRIDNIQHDIYNHLLRSALPAPLFLFRRSTIATIGFWDDKCLRFQDIRYYHRLFLYSIDGVWLPDYLYLVRIHETSISKKNDRKTLLSVLNVYSSIKNEWRLAHKLDLKLSRILFLLSVDFLVENYRYNVFWVGWRILKMLFLNVSESLFFLGFIFQRIVFSKKALEYYC